MSIDEIATAAHIKREQDKEFFRTMAWIIYTGSALNGYAINTPKKFPRIEDAFPGLFEEKAQQDWRTMKERVESFAKERRPLGSIE